MNDDTLHRIANAARFLANLNPQRYLFKSSYYLEGVFVHRQLWDTVDNIALTPVMIWSAVDNKYVGMGEFL